MTRRARFARCNGLFVVLGSFAAVLLIWFLEPHNLCEAKRPVSSDTEGPRLLSFYFPQYHPIPENDRFWGVNFTEWTNLRRYQQAASAYHDIAVPSRELGYYNLLDVNIRATQAKLARQYGLDGFVYYHYWFRGKPVMDGVLNAFLRDGQPNISFALCWANEHWTKRWDGGDNEVLLNQDYLHGDMEAHYKFLRQFWRHPLHVRHVNGAVPFFIYRISSQNKAPLAEIITRWRGWLKRDGLGPLHVVELLGFSHLDTVVPWADAVGEFWPLYGNMKAKTRHTDCQHRCHYPGTFVSWNNSPRHVSDGKATWLKQTPAAFGAALRAAIRKSGSIPSDCIKMVLISSWNEWGEGNFLEPDEVRGTQRLREVADAVRDSRPWTTVSMDKTCIVARTFAGHLSDPFYNVSAFVQSLRSSTVKWQLILLPTDTKDSLATFSASLREMFATDTRIQVVSPPEALMSAYDSCLSAYHLTDWAIRRCDPSTEWVVATNADNAYGARSFDALRGVPPDVDLLLLAAHSRYNRWNFFRHQLQLRPDCRPFPPRGETDGIDYRSADISQIVLRYRRVISDQVYFSSSYPLVCQAEDRETLKNLISSGWKHAVAHLSSDDETYVMHNPNPHSCHRLGGVWRDSADFKRFACVTKQEAPRIVLSHSGLGSFVCTADFIPEWGQTPSIYPTASNIAASKVIAAAMLGQAEHCGVRFDVPYYAYLSGVPEPAALSDWQHVGFISGQRYRWYRTERYDASMWASDSCFLLRAIGGRYVIRGQSSDDCWAQPAEKAFQGKSLVQKTCMRSQRGSGTQWCWNIHTCFEDKCEGCIDAPSADPYVAYTCGFAVNRYWIVGPHGMLCTHSRA